jgi:predicted nuclease of predicted toxin-antitoxin system
MKLLIDECLSPELAKLAQQRGHGESSHIVWLGKSGWKDWSLKAVILDGGLDIRHKELDTLSRPSKRARIQGAIC